MTVEQLYADIPIFLVRVMVVSFFSIGFIQFFQRLWNATFDQPNISSQRKWIRRIALTLLTVGLGTFVHLDAMLFVHNDSAIMYHNWALFILILPLLFGGFSKLEIVIQFLTLIQIWYMHHAPNMFEPLTLIALVLFVISIVLLKIYREKIIRQWGIGVLGAVIIASIFWFTVPEYSMGMKVTTEWALQAVLLFGTMVAFVLGYWIRHYREDMRKRQLERLADYERGIKNNSYVDHQKELQEMFKKAQDTGADLSFATFDLDNIKKVNDRFGRLAGNAILLGTSEIMKRVLSDSGIEYQLFLTSGEEYNVVFPGSKVQDALPVVEACWQGIRKSELQYKCHCFSWINRYTTRGYDCK